MKELANKSLIVSKLDNVNHYLFDRVLLIYGNYGW